MKDLKVLGVCGGQGALLFPFRDKLIGNIEPRGVFHTGREEQWKANFKGIPFLKGYELPEDWHPDIILSINLFFTKEAFLTSETPKYQEKD